MLCGRRSMTRGWLALAGLVGCSCLAIGDEGLEKPPPSLQALPSEAAILFGPEMQVVRRLLGTCAAR